LTFVNPVHVLVNENFGAVHLHVHGLIVEDPDGNPILVDQHV
jgi:hypothetical protein